MVTEKPHALWLAECLDELDAQFSRPGMCGEAATELRRLHAAHEHQYNMAGLMLREAERAERQRDDLLHALVTAMPFVEDAADDEVYKSHRVHKALGEIKAAIANAMGGAA